MKKNSNFYRVLLTLTLLVIIFMPSSARAEINLRAVAVAWNQINLHWTDDSYDNEERYELERSLDGINFEKIAEVRADVNSYFDDGLQPATSYWYRMRKDLPSDDGVIRDVDVSGNYAHIITRDGKLRVINVSNPSSPSQISEEELGFDPYEIELSGNYAYIIGARKGLAIVDISSPTNPIKRSYLDVSLNGLAIDGNYAYAVYSDSYNSTASIKVINISSPTNPTVETEVPIDTQEDSIFPYDIIVMGNYAYLASASTKVSVFNLTNPLNPTFIDYPDLQELKNLFRITENVNKQGFFICEHTKSDGTNLEGKRWIWDILDPEDPEWIGASGRFNAFYWAMEGRDDYLYTVFRSHPDGSSSIFEIITLDYPYFDTVSTFSLSHSSTWNLAVEGNYAYIPDHYELKIVDVSDPANPTLTGIFTTDAEPVIIKAVDRAQASPGDTLTYTLTYTNGNVVSNDVVIEDVVPTGTTFVSADSGGTFDGTIVSWNLGTLSVGQTGSVSFQVTIN